MRIVNHERRTPLALAAAVAWALACAASPAAAGEVAGSVVIRGAQVSMGGMLGGGPAAAMESAIGPGSYAGPVLVYVGEAAGALPARKSAPVRLRMTAAGLTPALQAITVGGVIEFENAD